MLELRPNCECCDKDLPPEAPDAMICTFECTFCADCAEHVLGGVCPNCGGNFSRARSARQRCLRNIPPRPNACSRPKAAAPQGRLTTIRTKAPMIRMMKRLASALLLLAAAMPAFAHLDPARARLLRRRLLASAVRAGPYPGDGRRRPLGGALGRQGALAGPPAFVGTMLAGFALGAGRAGLPFVEPVILASVVVSACSRGCAQVPAGRHGDGRLLRAVPWPCPWRRAGEAGALLRPGFALSTALLHAARRRHRPRHRPASAGAGRGCPRRWRLRRSAACGWSREELTR